ncbi:MAG: 2-C-methyl-D-erythritol 2,4-cyclodiphosphate synthase [Clostridia bacterium]|jgi:2-C-methyl-D-erythritol 4-phosphate cytidylyltransferase/2-C-methyl-D-erythritol 2,4-cyclodiphosphate synthase|nr:2-C-methyl-D-erythritol 2,4-cyclodiphosphate synthase [Clostridia bacterium]
MSKFNVILPCGGSGTRSGLSYNKLLLNVGGIPLLEKTLNIFYHDDVTKIIIAYNKDDLGSIKQIIKGRENILLCGGGASRTQSIKNALEYVEDDCDFVIIHDGARCFLSRECLERSMRDAVEYGTSVLYVNSVDSLRCVKDKISSPVDRNDIVRIQTPQIFKKSEITQAYALAKSDFSDDATLYEEYIKKPIHLTLGSEENIKVTTPADCEKINGGYLIGNGWDTHRLDVGRDLILGGIKIPHDKGLVAHSDGDVLIHAIMDAILSAMHERDIGVLFPDSDDKYKNISSALLLKEVLALAKTKGLAVKSISAVIMAQKPKLSPHIPTIQSNLANIMDVEENCVSLSATTTEKLGMTGREEGISVSSVAVLRNK